jgi:hypothetical protein
MSNLKNDLSGGDILTYDISVSPPVLLGSVSGHSLHFTTDGRYLFAALGGMDIYDISGQLPQFQGHVDGINAQAVKGTQVLASTIQQGCRLVDISNPQTPTISAVLFAGLIGVCEYPFFKDKYVYGSEYVGGTAIYDASVGGGPAYQSRLYGGGATWSDTYDLLLQSPYLYGAAATGFGGTVSVYDTQTKPPARIGQYFDPSQQAYALALSGNSNSLYVGMSNSTAILDISNPASPVLAASIPVRAISFARLNNVLYAGTSDAQLVAMDITNPTQPVVVRTISLPDYPVKIRIYGNVMFVADNSGGLFIYNLTSPTTPALISNLSSFTWVADVAVNGNIAFVAADSEGLGILDISNPSHPILLSKTGLSTIIPFGSWAHLNQALSIAVDNGLVYVGTLNDNGLVFGFDCANLTQPRLVSVYAHGDYIFTWVGSLLFNGTELFVGGSLGNTFPVAQVDMSQPRDNITQFFPPLALQNPGTLDYRQPPAAALRYSGRFIDRFQRSGGNSDQQRARSHPYRWRHKEVLGLDSKSLQPKDRK